MKNFPSVQDEIYDIMIYSPTSRKPHHISNILLRYEALLSMLDKETATSQRAVLLQERDAFVSAHPYLFKEDQYVCSL